MVQRLAMGHLNSPDVDVLIVGAGPTGLALAAEAARLRLRYRIVDKSAHGAVHSRALLLHGRTLEQLERYDLAGEAVGAGRCLQSIRVYSEGKRILEASFADIPAKYPFVLFLPQPKTERLLAQHIESQGGLVEREVTLEYFEARDDSVECVVIGKTGARDTITASYVVGADGASSTVRELLGTPVHEYSEPFGFLIGDLHVEGNARSDELAVYLHGPRFILIGRIDETHHRVVVASERDVDPDTVQLADFQSRIDDAGIENVRVSDPRWMTAFNVQRLVAESYSRGRVFLAGDAASVHAPLAGQGLNGGIQDAGNLMWKLALALRLPVSPLVIESYDRERRPVAQTLDRDTNLAVRAATASNWVLERLRDGILSRLASVDALRGRLAAQAFELGLHYRNSAIVCECGGEGALRAGDRAPDCEIIDAGGARNTLAQYLKQATHVGLLHGGTPREVTRFETIVRQRADVLLGVQVDQGDSTFKNRYACPDGCLYVIRPDGYVGFRGLPHDVDALDAWLAGLFALPR